MKVSICIPTYNCAKYLATTIDSVLAQNFDDYELVICDDGSTDGTQELCAGYDDPRIRYLRGEKPSGQAGNFNRCLREARGEYLTILHADDYFLPGFLRDRVSRLDADAELGLVFGTVQVVDGDGKEVSCDGRWNEDRRFEKGGLVEPLVHGCIVCPPSMMVRRSCVPEVGEFRTDLTWGHDWEWALRLAEQCACQYAAEPLAAYRAHDESGTAEQLSAAKNGPQERRILQETLARIAPHNGQAGELRRSAFRALSRRHMYFAEQALFDGKRPAARSNLYYAVLADMKLLAKPTYWALLAGSIGTVGLYRGYRRIRGTPVPAGND